MFTSTARSLALLSCFTFAVQTLHAVDYTWQGGTAATNILDPANWLGGIVPPNDATSIITLTAADKILFAAGPQLIPNAPAGARINVPAGAQILVNTGPADQHKRIEAQVAMAGTGPDGNGALFVQSAVWGQPQNTLLTGATTITATGQRFRIDAGPNRLDLAGNTLTVGGAGGETNFVNTNIYNTSGAIIANQIFSVEGSTRFDPAVTVTMSPGMLHTSWDGNNDRREHATIMRNNAIIETRKQDRDLTFTGPLTVAANDTAIFRPQIQAVTQPGDGTDQRLNMMSAITGAGAVRKDGNGTLVLSGNSNHTGGTTLNGSGATLAASDAAFGTGPVTVGVASTVHLSNAGGLESRDALARDAAVGASTTVNPVLSGLHSTQGYDETRWSYTGKINNTSANPVVYSFVEQYDDDVFLTVDGVTVLNDTNWNVVTNGQVTLTPGEHDIRISVRNGGGGAGPNSGFEASGVEYGVGMSTALPLGGATMVAADYTKLGGTLQVYQNSNRTVANPFVLNAPLTLTTSEMNGYTATLTGPLSGPSNLVAQGSTAFATDQLILGGTNTYAGDTMVEGGANLQMNGTHTNAASYAVNATAVLTINGTLIITDAATPNAPADLSLTNAGQASFASGATLRLDLFSDQPGTGGAGSENDELLVSGSISLTLGGALAVGNPNNIATFSVGDAWDLFDWNTAPTGTFNSVTLPTLPAGLAWNSSDLYAGGAIAVVPEPSAAALLALLAGLAGFRRRRH